MFDFDAGLNCTWNEERPVKAPPPREFPDEYPLHCKEEWERGYDHGLELARQWRDGRKQGKGGLACVGKGAFASGWRSGRRRWLLGLFLPLVKAPLGLVVKEVSYPDRDDVTGADYPGGVRYRALKRADLVRDCVAALTEWWGHHRPVPTSVDGMVKLYEEYNDSDWGRVHIITRAEAKKERGEAELARMERAAAEFASRCGVRVGSMKFLHELERAAAANEQSRRDWNDPERRMEEWADCMYAGGGRDQYFDDLNYVNESHGRAAATLQDVWGYVQRKFPLTVLKYKERNARRNRSDSQQ